MGLKRLWSSFWDLLARRGIFLKDFLTTFRMTSASECQTPVDGIDAVFDYAERNRKGLIRLAGRYLRHCSSSTSGEDILQEALMRAWRGRETYQPGSNPRAWLHTIIHHVAVENLRRRKHMPYGELPTHVSEENDIKQEHVYLPIRQSPRALAEILQTEFNNLVRVAINTLSPRIREVAAFHYYGEYTTREIAGLLGIAEGTIKSQLHRARQALKPYLQAYAQ